MSRTALFIDWNNPPQLQEKEFVGETTYDALNRPVTVTQPDTRTTSYIYDKGGLLKQVLHNSTQHITNITYNPRGQRENIYYGNSTKTRYYYNPLNFRLTRILTTRNNGQDVLQDLNYTYDAAGNITGITDNAQQTFYFNNQVIAPTGSYTYDALYRLLTATGRELTNLSMPTDTDFPNNIPCPDTATNAMQNYTQHYQYDALGNMLQMSSQNQWTRDYIYDTATNRLLRHTQQLPNTYSYDTHGNMLTMPHLTSMAWDYLDQLHSAGNGTFTSFYNYDAEGNRTRKVVVKNNIREERYYIGGYEVFRKYINDTLDFERKTINISDDEKVFVRIEQKTGENPVIRYQYDNHLGSACLELDELGAIISYEEYHPFGTTSYRSGRTETEVSLKRYKYCGKERDEETGLYYYGMRYYAAWLCRFVSVDTLQFKYPALTPFQYASNRPVTMIDLDGEEGVSPNSNLTADIKCYIESYEFKNGSLTKNIKIIGQKSSFVHLKDGKNYFNTETKGIDATYKFSAPTNTWELIDIKTAKRIESKEVTTIGEKISNFMKVLVSDGDFGADAANTGKITKDDIKVGGTIIATIASGGVLLESKNALFAVLASLGFINNVDNLFINNQGDSGLQQLFDDYKTSIMYGKNAVGGLSIIVGGANPSELIQSPFKIIDFSTGLGFNINDVIEGNKSNNNQNNILINDLNTPFFNKSNDNIDSTWIKMIEDL